MMIVCDVCGNEREWAVLSCPFCGASSDGAAQEKAVEYVHKTVNLEAGRPVVEVALNRLTETLDDAVRTDVSVVTLIHGYGSSGKGGVIKEECRKMLEFLKTRGQIRDYIPGEEFNRRSGPVKVLLKRYPKLGKDRNLNRSNRGITVVVFSANLLFLNNDIITSFVYAAFGS